jgi:hypothetical protein
MKRKGGMKKINWINVHQTGMVSTEKENN